MILSAKMTGVADEVAAKVVLEMSKDADAIHLAMQTASDEWDKEILESVEKHKVFAGAHLENQRLLAFSVSRNRIDIDVTRANLQAIKDDIKDIKARQSFEATNLNAKLDLLISRNQ